MNLNVSSAFRSFGLILSLAVSMLLLNACKDNDPTPLLFITSFTPSGGIIGSSVTITGTNFSTATTDNEVKFNGVTASVTASTATTLTVTVPAGATTGKISVTIGTRTATSSTDFEVGFEAVKAGGATSSDDAFGVAVDASGNTYVAGYFVGTSTFGTTTLTAFGDEDIVISKYNTSGEVVWAKKAGGTGADRSYSIALDATGNLYVTGEFAATATFGTTTLVADGSTDIFVAKYTTSGDLVWAQKAGGTSEDHGKSVSLDDAGNAYITGYFEGTATFGTTTLTAAGVDIFIAKYTSSGEAVWAMQAGGDATDKGNSVAADASGNTYIAGSFEGTATFGSTSLTSAGLNDIYVAKYTASGEVAWAKKAGGTVTDFANSVALDGAGNLYITGHFFDMASFGTINVTSANRLYSAFVAKYSTSGEPIWVRQGDGQNLNVSNAVAVDASGTLYITGFFFNAVTFGATTLNAVGAYDLFVVMYTASGDLVWAKGVGGSSIDIGSAVAFGASGNAYVAGSFQGTSTFGTTTLTTEESSDIFLWKIKP